MIPIQLNDALPIMSSFLKNPILPSRVFKAHGARGGSTPTFPSFAVCLDKKIRQDKIRELSGDQNTMAKLLRRKKWVDSFLELNKIPYVPVIHEEFKLQDINVILNKQKTGVIKPIYSTNSWGVIPYSRCSENEVINIKTNDRLKTSQLMKLLHDDMQRYMFPNRWRVERLMESADPAVSIPDDYKVYCFYGCAPLILQVRKNKNQSKYRFYDEENISIQVGKYNSDLDENLIPSAQLNEVRKYALKIIQLLRIPFVRIDFYCTPEGPVVGELTPEPGGYHKFDRIADVYLGFQWELAELRLLI